ncbi:MAG: sulfatase-like hydrolase/transferase [Elusimicrobiota bacterium]|jgi:phosphoglycerol transferase MdoB-like AlkP superfamily enzyme|nr:sulfatase-like hydrolase/transferase [Elusimicrobiota bacterium]
MKKLREILFKIARVNLVFLAFMSLYRALFFLYYKKGMDLTGMGYDIFKAFYMGFRFDLSVIAGINAPPALVFIVLFLIGKSSLFLKFFDLLKFYYTAFIGFLAVLFCIDFNFYAYFADHLNILIYGFIEDDTLALLKTFYQNYHIFLIALGLIAAFVLIFFISHKLLKLKNDNLALPKIKIRIIISVIIPFILFIAIRGTFNWNSIGQYSDISSNTFINKTAINCIFTLQRAIEHKSNERQDIDYIEQTGYQDNIRQAFADFLGRDISEIPQDEPEKALIARTAKNAQIESIKPNVILILMESFGGDIVKYNSANFNILGALKEHFDQDFVFYNFTSEGTVTIQAIEATFLNILLRPDSPIYVSQSKYLYNKYPFAAVAPYKQNDYEAIFIYGDNTSWRNSGEFALNSGFDSALSAANEKEGSPRGAWGIYDEYLFDLVFETLEKGGQRKFLHIMTTTNHPPYTLPSNYKILPLNIPEELKDKISDLSDAQKRFAAIQYANEMLGRFISKIKNSKYGANTIIAVTGDHSFNSYQIDAFFNRIKVPLYLYIPKALQTKSIDTAVFGSHLDIMPTLYNLSLSNTQYMSQGTDLLSVSSAGGNAAFYKNYIISGDSIVEDDIFNNMKSFYTWGKNSNFEFSDETDNHKKLLKKFLSTIAVSDYLLKNTGAKKGISK